MDLNVVAARRRLPVASHPARARELRGAGAPDPREDRR